MKILSLKQCKDSLGVGVHNYKHLKNMMKDIEIICYLHGWWDQLSWPGNDFYKNARVTDDGVKAVATNVMSIMTGYPGSYCNVSGKYLAKRTSGEKVLLWADILSVLQIRFNLQGLSVYDLQALMSDRDKTHCNSAEIQAPTVEGADDSVNTLNDNQSRLLDSQGERPEAAGGAAESVRMNLSSRSRLLDRQSERPEAAGGAAESVRMNLSSRSRLLDRQSERPEAARRTAEPVGTSLTNTERLLMCREQESEDRGRS